MGMRHDIPTFRNQEAPGDLAGARSANGKNCQAELGWPDRRSNQDIRDAPTAGAAAAAAKRRQTFAARAKGGDLPEGVGRPVSQRALAVHLLRQFVNEHHLGVTEAARTLEFSQSAVSEWLSGKRLPGMKFAGMLLSRMEQINRDARQPVEAASSLPVMTPAPRLPGPAEIKQPTPLPEELLKAFSDAVVALMRKQTSVDGCTKILTAAVAASE